MTAERQNTQHLVERAKAGDRRAFDCIVERFHDRLRGTIRRRVAAALEAQAPEAGTRYEGRYRMGSRPEILAMEGRHREAVATFERALDLDPGRAWRENLRCMRRFQLGEAERAVECYGEAASRDANVYTASLTEVLGALGRPEEAAAAACATLVVHPEKDEAMKDLLRVVRERGDGVLPRDLLQSLEEAACGPAANAVSPMRTGPATRFPSREGGKVEPLP